MLEFIAALYNEENEVDDLFQHIWHYVDKVHFVDDCSTDNTQKILNRYLFEADRTEFAGDFEWHSMPKHTGLPETVKNEALKMCEDDSWVLMLDADERFEDGVLGQIRKFVLSDASKDIDYVYFRQLEFIDGKHERTFQKSKLFRKGVIAFSTTIHEDDEFIGNGIYRDDWVVIHRKTSQKQVKREKEYLETYKKLYEDGKIDAGRLDWLTNLHHFVRR